jgi:MFS family permease
MPDHGIEKLPTTVLEDPTSESQLAPWQESLSRWSLFLCVSWVNFGIGWVWLAQASSEIQSHIFYENITPVQFRLLNEIFLYVYIPIGPVGCYLIDKHFKLAIFISAATLSAGSVLSYFAGNSYNLALTANFIMGLCQATTFPASAFMANRYFPEKLVQVIVVLPLFMNILGNGAAQWYPIFLMDDTHEDSLIHERFSTIHMMGMFSCVPSLLFFIPFWLWPLKPRISIKSDVKATEEYKPLLLED